MDLKITRITNEEQKNFPHRSKTWKQETGDNVMGKLSQYDDVDPYSEVDAKEEFDEWQKQAIMDDKAQ